MAGKAVVLEVPGPAGVGREVRISSPDRLIWPASPGSGDLGITKLQLAEYTVTVAEAMMRALGDRPVTLQRFPEGIEGEEFFSKNPPRGVPGWARSVICTYPSGRSHPQLVIDEIATAVWAVQMNTVTFHPWPVRSADNDNPDELRIDLDPMPGTGWPEVDDRFLRPVENLVPSVRPLLTLTEQLDGASRESEVAEEVTIDIAADVLFAFDNARRRWPTCWVPCWPLPGSPGPG